MELHPLEAKVLEALQKSKELTPAELAIKTKLPEASSTRAAFWLADKGLVQTIEKSEDSLKITAEGLELLSTGTPEKKVLQQLKKGNKTLEHLTQATSLEAKILSAAIGRLKAGGLAEFLNTEEPSVAATVKGVDFLEKKTDEEKALEELSKGEVPLKSVKVASELLKRHWVEKVTRVSRLFSITRKGNDVKPTAVRANVLTSDMIRSGTAELRPYDIAAPAARIYPGRLHPLRGLINKVRRIFLDMGFTEAAGPYVESTFWCFDALFQPQDHPARDLADTFYMSEPKETKLPENLVPRVKKAHESGVAGSTGWQYDWSPTIAKQPVLRTHTTAVSARSLSQLNPPAKIFTVDRVFRNETLDYKHLMELHQIEGIVFDESVTFKHLLGYLKTFYSKMGFDKLRFRPAYFPYTEMSVEPEVYFPKRKEWIELGGAGIFRPEVVEPLTGIDSPVLAWGLGLERLMMLMVEGQDIRLPYVNDLEWVRRNQIE